MKGLILLLVMLLLTPLVGFGQTRPHWLDIRNTPLYDIREYGARQGEDCSAAVASAAAAAGISKTTGGTVFIPAGLWQMNVSLPSTARVVGAGTGSVIRAHSTSSAAITFTANETNWAYGLVSDLTVDGEGKSRIGIAFSSDPNAGRVEFSRVRFYDCSIGLYKIAAIGVRINACQFKNNAIGLYAKAQISPLQNAGVMSIEHSTLEENTQAALLIEEVVTGAVGLITISNTVFQYNSGHSIFVKNLKGTVKTHAPLVLQNMWFEEETTQTGNVTVLGVTSLARNIHSINSEVIIQNTCVESLLASNSRLLMNNVTMGFVGGFYSVANYDSQIVWENRGELGGSAQPGDGLTLSFGRVGTLNFFPPFTGMSYFKLPHRTTVSTTAFKDYSYIGVSIASAPYAYNQNNGTVTMGTPVGAPILFDSCRNLVGTSTSEVFVLSELLISQIATAPNSLYFVWTLDVKRNNATDESGHGGLVLSRVYNNKGTIASNSVAITGLPKGEWTTIGGIFQYAGAGEIALLPGVLPHPTEQGNYDISAFQLLGFPSESQAKSFLQSGIFVHSDSQGR